MSNSFHCVSDHRATLRLSRFYEASILVARHLSASRFQWQLLGGLMNSTGHSVYPHVTLSALLTKWKVSFSPPPVKYTPTLYTQEFRHSQDVKWQSIDKNSKFDTLWHRNDWTCPSNLATVTRRGLSVTATWRRVFERRRASQENRMRKNRRRECEMNVLSERKDVCEEEWAVPVICDVLSSCLYAYSLCILAGSST